nr:MAG TPA: hypothetical protein [Caudoviricetes sp.]
MKYQYGIKMVYLRDTTFSQNTGRTKPTDIFGARS